MKEKIKRIAKRLRERCALWYNWDSFHGTYEYVGFLKYLWKQVFHCFPNKRYYPVDKNSTVCGNIVVGRNSKVTQRGGCYVQGWGKVFIGDYVTVTQNCIIVSSNHLLTNHLEHTYKETIIGDHCWIASNSFIGAGVVLGPRTVVAAGSVVTKSFPDGYCLIGGNPAKVLKEIPKEDFIPRVEKHPMYGYIPETKFKEYLCNNWNGISFEYDLSTITSNSLLVDFFGKK